MVISDLKQLLESDTQLPKELQGFPSMQTLKEKDFLYKLAKSYYNNEGLIFDAGLYLGVSTLCFSQGIICNSKVNFENSVVKPIKSFELGICTSGIAKKINKIYPEYLEMKEGDSFLPILRKNIHDFNHLVELYEGDITETLTALPNLNYEIVFLDVLKTSTVNDCVLKKVFPYLIPGKSIVIQQDFVTPLLPWIQISMGFLKNYFEYLFTYSATTVYLNTKPIPKGAFSRKFYEDYSLGEMLELFDQSIPKDLSEVGYYKMKLAKGLLIAEKLGLKEGIAYLENCRNQYDSLVKERPWLFSVNRQIMNAIERTATFA